MSTSKTKRNASFTPTQIKLLLKRLEEEGAAIINAPHARNAEKLAKSLDERKKRYHKAIMQWLSSMPASMREEAAGAITYRCRGEDDSLLNLDKVVSTEYLKLETPALPRYEPESVWRREGKRYTLNLAHPLGKMLKDLEFQLTMQTGEVDATQIINDFKEKLSKEMVKK